MNVKSLSALEQEIMNIFWESRPCTVRDVLTRLNKTKRLAYTTVMTVMGRMVKKGALVRTLEGSVYRYRPAFTKRTYLASSVHSIVASAVATLGSEAIAYFSKEIRGMNEKKRKRLLKILDAST